MVRDHNTLSLFEPPPVIRAAPQTGDPDGLRYYQREAVDAVFSSLESSRSTLIVLATGLGKTQCFSAVAKHWPGRVLVLAHRDELVQQARKRLEHMTNERVEIEQAQLRSGRARIVVGSVQTCYQPKRLEVLERRGGFSLIIVDEAHHYVSPAYKRPLDHFDGAKILGVTATPDRGDAQALGKLFDDVAYTMGMREGVAAGYLVPLKGREVFIDEIKLDSVSVTGGDFAAGELDQAILEGVEGVVKGMLHHAGDKQGILFFPGVQSSKVAAARLNALKPDCAVSVDGETPKEERDKIMRDFRAGRVQILCNCMVATEGFDAPTVSVVGLARPTKSRALYAQMVGRGTRVLPGVIDRIEGLDGAEARRAAIAASGKPSCLLIDFTGKNSKHSLMTPVDLLGGEYNEEVRQRAKKLAEDPENEDKDVGEVVEMAKTELDNEAIAKAAIHVRSSVKSRTRTFDPFAAFGVDQEAEAKYQLEYGYKPKTEKQGQLLKRLGFDQEDIDQMSAKMATKMIGLAIQRQRAGLATPGQLKLLSKYGISSTKISIARAKSAIDYIASNNWGKASTFDPVRVHDILFEAK